METISNYLDTMFIKLPKTKEVLRAKEELSNLMEDKYNELKSEGKTENEAVGIVISEFGNLDEVAGELGLLNYVDGKNEAHQNGKASRYITMDEAREYIEAARQTSKFITIGVALCIWSPILLIILGGLQQVYPSVSDGIVTGLGVSTLLVLVAIAVAIFIMKGSKLSKYEAWKKEILEIDSSTEEYVRNHLELTRQKATSKIAIGVVLCIIAVIPVIILASIYSSDNARIEFGSAIMFGAMLVIISIAVSLFILSSATIEPCKVLLQEEEYSVTQKENKLAGIIASVYWPIVVCIYLGYSFITMRWEISWIIWPVAGILFGAIATVCSLLERANK